MSIGAGVYFAGLTWKTVTLVKGVLARAVAKSASIADRACRGRAGSSADAPDHRRPDTSTFLSPDSPPGARWPMADVVAKGGIGRLR
eukprot:6635210-Prymnesium_polylepis.1